VAARTRGGGAEPPGPPPRKHRPYRGYCAQLDESKSGEWELVYTFSNRVYGSYAAKMLREGTWAVPEGTRTRDWAFRGKSRFVDGTSELWARYKPNAKK
jgi:hypothetical protein